MDSKTFEKVVEGVEMTWLWWLLAAPLIFYLSLKMDDWKAIREHRKREQAARLARIEADLREIREDLKRLKSN